MGAHLLIGHAFLYGMCAEFPTGNRKRITRVNACESETSATGHFAFSEFANATALPFARRPRASGFTSETPTCLPSYHGMLAITRSPHELQPTHPTRRAARPAGQPLSEPSKRAIDASRAGGTPASATGAWHLNCVAGMARAACNSVNYGRSTRA